MSSNQAFDSKEFGTGDDVFLQNECLDSKTTSITCSKTDIKTDFKTEIISPGASSPTPQDEPKISFLQLYKFTNLSEKCLLFLAILLATFHGVLLPYLFTQFGDMTNAYVDNARYQDCFFVCGVCKEMDLYFGECGCTSQENCEFYSPFKVFGRPKLSTFEHFQNNFNFVLLKSHKISADRNKKFQTHCTIRFYLWTERLLRTIQNV